MKLKIENCDDKGFIVFLIKELRKYLISKSNSRKLIKIEDYINSIDTIKSPKIKRRIKCKEIILAAAHNLKFRKYGKNTYEIFIDPNQKLFGTKAKLYNLCMLINFGTMSVNGYPIFTEAFNYIESHIDNLYSLYEMENNK